MACVKSFVYLSRNCKCSYVNRRANLDDDDDDEDGDDNDDDDCLIY